MLINLRTKVISITVGILFLAMGVLTILSTNLFKREYSKVLIENGFVIGRNLEIQLDRLLRLGIYIKDLIGFDEQCKSIVEEYSYISYAMIADLDGIILFHSDPIQRGKTITEEAALKAIRSVEESVYISSLDDDKYQSMVIPILNPYGEHIAAAIIGFPMELIVEATTRLVNYSIWIALVSFGIAILFLVFSLSLWVTNPLRKLMDAIQEIREKGVLTARVNVKSRDEIGQLASTFDNMTEELQKTTTSIDNLNREVVERKKAEEKYRIQFEGALDAIFVADAETGILIDCNPAATILVGREKPELIGKHQSILHPPGRIIEGEFTKTFKEHLSKKKGQTIETQIITKNGEVREVAIKASLLEIEGIKVMQGIFRDVTEQKRAEHRLQAAYAQLKETQDQLIQAEKLNAVGQLASGVAHEVKNPLGIILQGVSFLEKDVESKKAPETKDVLDTIKSNVHRADNIIRALVDFSRAGKLILEPQDISSVIESSLFLVDHKIKIANIKIIKELQKDLPKVLIDKNRIEQVLVNLFLNAIQSMTKEGKLFIRAYTTQLNMVKKGIGRRSEDIFRPGETAMIIEVEDTGIGISEKDLNRVFDPFFTTKGPRHGAGLGLAVTKNIIGMHSGLIEMQSKLGKGTKVIVILKLKKEAA